MILYIFYVVKNSQSPHLVLNCNKYCIIAYECPEIDPIPNIYRTNIFYRGAEIICSLDYEKNWINTLQAGNNPNNDSKISFVH
ncbi:hypothetical protein GLOIN_2v516319 [Rhizophagus irregularis DAOM 181602=DAOM 197198]|uniref:Uncharacterized protein n=1 Tax=Rhizophagus irregularis (strain DAOM 181602 / DAOM 197198 / MUCL 43194) TaxID=747089 RepID=A0A2P4PF03_RHIID|nr:hypothetical protein GLOIN_2v516319 [Rhizophagus irregularis DAOM 181602=DAOM 197198]POG63968.1 hypothetical protein GLOIN_2v516319 [Rhizophagus irregularis DAOM 181602=DAOM 197198]GET59460.1 hypothetical protein GLOIN_2v516319 [Rhizophagus irregularis DAOM 181602=DAOM 197198]|eukprot:XP_025170834.1 hypothetical protein GLOIN_2v516319 [Rhizophagus irregularis DAOM 181602=DAOM 197198]